MIQWYDDRPSDPAEAFFYFERIFSEPFSRGLPFSHNDMYAYVERMLIADHELDLYLLSTWSLPAKHAFTPHLFFEFRQVVLALFPTLWAGVSKRYFTR